MNGLIASMNWAWTEERRQVKKDIGRLTEEIEGLSDASRMRMIVQQFAREVIPDAQQTCD